MSRFDLNALIKNNYFYGKLLTVRDFKTEQEYIESRQRMHNRLTMGYGVVCGLRTVMIDNQTLSVEPGMAIDAEGREIVIPFPVTEKLSLVEGFKELTDAKELYLCLSYNEEGHERVQTVSNVQESLDSLSEYNRTKESYKLSLRKKGPDMATVLSNDVVHEKKTVFDHEEVQVDIVYPKVVLNSETIEVKVVVNKKNPESHIDYEFGVHLLDAMDKGFMTETTFASIKLENDWINQSVENYEVACRLIEHDRVLLQVGESGHVVLNGEKFDLSPVAIDIQVIEKGLEEWVQDAYYRQSLHDVTSAYVEDCLYLAKIQLLKVDDTFLMKGLNFNPFDQYAYGSSALMELMKSNKKSNFNGFAVKTDTKVLEAGTAPEVSATFDKGTGSLNMTFGMPDPLVMVDSIRTGIVEFTVDENFMFGKNIVSDELSHGLGNGPVFIQLGIENIREGFDGDESEKIYYGASEVFYRGDYEGDVSNYTFGSVVYPRKGTFRVGLRINKGTRGDVIRLRWWAYKEQSGYTSPESIKVKISPEEIDLNPGELLQFTAHVQGDKSHSVTWSLEDDTAGSINDYGEFIAGNVDGNYKIIATSVKDPGSYAESYVRIKGEGKLDKLKKIKI